MIKVAVNKYLTVTFNRCFIDVFVVVVNFHGGEVVRRPNVVLTITIDKEPKHCHTNETYISKDFHNS